MNELRGKYVNVVLGVEEGKGMDFLKHPVYIIAHFNGRIMESDCVEPLSTPDFNTELVWETEKKTIRKVRSTNSPLRVECFSIDEYGKKECIGFTLLSLRSANIIPANRPDIQIPIKWFKLIGVPAQYKKSHPELYLSLTLRDHCINSTMPPAIATFPDTMEAPESNETKIIPVKFVEGGYIQIGEDKSNEKFELKITVKMASNLDILLPKDVVFAPNIDKFYISFNLFGVTINTKSFYRDLHETIILNENIVVKLQSMFDVLKMFFAQFDEVIVHFCHGTTSLASTKINMEKSIPSDIDAIEFKGKYKAWLGALCLCISFLSSPLIVAICRRKSARLAAVLGGLVLALSCLFTSFAMQFHQALLSYGVVLGIGAGIVRETSGLVLGHYFKRRREFVEMVCQTGAGVGMALFSVLYKEAVGKLGWRLGLQAVTGLLSLAFFLPVVYRSANLYHPQRRAITHLKNQRKKVKEKKTHAKVKKPPMFDFSPLKSRGLRILLVASASGALGIYAPIIYLAYQGYREGLEDSALVLLQTFLGFASALGCVGFGLVTVKPSSQCLISRQYLCQASMVGISISLLALSAVQGYHGYVLFVWMYGICLGGYSYSLKMFTLERIKARHFTKAWSFIQGAKSIPVLIGIPITGYINQTYPKYGYYFSFVTTLLGASLLFLVGNKKEPIVINNTNVTNCNYNVPNLNECICPLGAYGNIYAHEISPYNIYRQTGNHYERVFANYEPINRNSLQRHSYKHKLEHQPMRYLPKSLSYAANIERSPYSGPKYAESDFARYNHVMHARNNLRPSKSFPEGLGRWDHYGSYRRPFVRNVQVIEQITTSV